MKNNSIYKIPIENADEYLLNFFHEFEETYPKFAIIKHYVKKIVIEQVEQMSEQDLAMVYLNNKIYISPMLRNKGYIEEGLIHEIGHILLSRSEINNNDQVKDEFFFKRKMVLDSLMQQFEVSQRIQDLFKNLEDFSPELDKFLNEIIGYEKLGPHISGCFLDPYAISSFDEYLATGFQLYYSEYRNALKKTNPILYREIDKLIDRF